MKILNDEITGLPERLKLARNALDLGQSEFASKCEVGYSTYQKYELGMSKPGCDAIEGFVRIGINANWLLTGAGEMLIIQNSNDKKENDNVDMSLLKLCLSTCSRSIGEEFLKLDIDTQLNLATDLYAKIETVTNSLGLDAKNKETLKLDETGLVIKLDKDNPPPKTISPKIQNPNPNKFYGF